MTIDAATIAAVDDRLAALKVAPGAGIALAVSGGGDSMALAVLLQNWAVRHGGTLLALTVDHGLRAGSAAEAVATGGALAQLNIPHQILNWQGEKPVTHIQERARDARYRLLVKAAKAAGLQTLAVAHNLEDQLETFWMRLAHGSGLDGLAGMAAARHMDGVRVIRPLLGLPRETLRNVCSNAGITWVEDPSNTNDKFLRVRLRAFEEKLAEEGLTPQRLAATLQKLEDARQALTAVTENALVAAAELLPEGYAALLLPPWQEQPAEIQRRMLSRLLHSVWPQDYTVGHDALEQLRSGLLAGDFAGRTVAGCDVFKGRGGRVYVAREAAGIPARTPLENGAIWDGRFMVSGYQAAANPESFYLAPLNAAALAHLRKKLDEKSAPRKQLDVLPDKIRRTLAGVYNGQNLLAVPQLSWLDGAAPKALEQLKLAIIAPHLGTSGGA
ncbi:MAG: tRNA lysidine(34) synthetase TilS [Micavibrio sp.]|nr:tRNA lysidine(34) synthetase TilS [Micavibrio sp.]